MAKMVIPTADGEIDVDEFDDGFTFGRSMPDNLTLREVELLANAQGQIVEAIVKRLLRYGKGRDVHVPISQVVKSVWKTAGIRCPEETP